MAEISKTRPISNTVAFSSIFLSVVCFAALIHVEIELHVHRQMLQVLNQQREEKLELRNTANDENESLMKILHGDSNKVAGSHNRHKRHVETTDKEENASKIIDREVLKKELRLVLNSHIHCSRGIRGRRGRPGPRGSPGKHGPLGPQGPQGPKGDQGTQGIQGTPGPKGNQGTQGIQGTPRPKGDRGTQGIHGTPGPKGNQGTQEIQGAPGPKGDRGTQGIHGTPGPKGNQGTQGIQGTPGPKGDRGIQGTPGPKGNQGPQGAKGDSGTYTSCSDYKSIFSGSPSGNYVIDPDGRGGVSSFSVYCDMSDKGGVGVTVISHDSESRTHVGPSIPGCSYSNPGCYSKDVRYTGVSTAQLAALTRVSQNCEQFIKFECNNDVSFIYESRAWWVSRDGTQMNYWGGATGHDNMCACGVTNSCSNYQNCNCYGGNSASASAGWREDSGLLTDKSALPVAQIRLSDLDESNEEGYHTLGKLKCYGQT